jgi:mRNA-degrading endonuclease toxin of MazEF toxin-antitoxin module
VDAINRQPLVIAVVVGTDAKNVPRDYTINVRVTAKETGLPIDTVFLCFQLRSLDSAVSLIQRLTARISPGLSHKLVWPR